MDFNQEEYGGLKRDVAYLIKCCDDMRQQVSGIQTRNTAILTSVILLLVGVVVNLILTYAK
jgi:hypothetical protein